jgi:hypothetical protein
MYTHFLAKQGKKSDMANVGDAEARSPMADTWVRGDPRRPSSEISRPDRRRRTSTDLHDSAPHVTAFLDHLARRAASYTTPREYVMPN